MESSTCEPDKIIFDQERGEYICTETGEVIEDRVVDGGAEWRAFEPERVRAEKMTEFLHDKGISTTIGVMKIDNTEERMKIARLRVLQEKARVKSSADRNLSKALKELERIGSLLNLPKAVKEEAAVIYREAVKKKIVMGRSIDSVLAASIYVACRKMKVAVSLDDIAKYSKADKKEVARHYRTLMIRLKIKVPVNDAKEHAIKIAELLGVSGKTTVKAIEIIEKVREKGISSGKEPASIAAASLYIACLLNDERRTQKEISMTAGITETTLRMRYKEIMKALKITLQTKQQE